MGWRQIGNGLYYYQSRRVGGRVVSEYVGRGEIAALISATESGFRREREAELAERRTEREEFDRRESDIREWFARTERLAELALAMAGYHKHRGQWRRRRHGEPCESEAAPESGV